MNWDLIETLLQVVPEKDVVVVVVSIASAIIGGALVVVAWGIPPGDTVRAAIPFLSKNLARIVTSIAGVLFATIGAWGLYTYATIKTLVVVTSLTEEEYEQLRGLQHEFETEQRKRKGHVRVESENVDPRELVGILKTRHVDLVISDINRRMEMVREGVIVPIDPSWNGEFSGNPNERYDFSRYIPSSVHPALLDSMKIDGYRYFLPYRPNVRIAWSRSDQSAKLKSSDECASAPKTWQEVAKHARQGKRVLLSAKGSKEQDDSLDAALLLLEIIQAAEKPKVVAAQAALAKALSDQYVECEAPLVCEPPAEAARCSSARARTQTARKALDSTKERMEVAPKNLKAIWNNGDSSSPLLFLRDLVSVAAQESRTADWQNSTGHLIANNVDIARNWSFSVSVLRRSGELHRFCPRLGWIWDTSEGDVPPENFHTLLGGDVLALPKRANHPGEVRLFIAFLLSQKAQRLMVNGVAWPPMRFDARPTPPEQPAANLQMNESEAARKNYNLASDAVTLAMAAATPTPNYWSSEMHAAYLVAFRTIMDAKDLSDVSKTLEQRIPLFWDAPLEGNLVVEAEPSSAAWTNVWDPPFIRLTLQERDHKGLHATSYHTDLCAFIRFRPSAAGGEIREKVQLDAGHQWVEKRLGPKESFKPFPRRISVDQVAVHRGSCAEEEPENGGLKATPFSWIHLPWYGWTLLITLAALVIRVFSRSTFARVYLNVLIGLGIMLVLVGELACIDLLEPIESAISWISPGLRALAYLSLGIVPVALWRLRFRG